MGRSVGDQLSMLDQVKFDLGIPLDDISMVPSVNLTLDCRMAVIRHIFELSMFFWNFTSEDIAELRKNVDFDYVWREKIAVDNECHDLYRRFWWWFEHFPLDAQMLVIDYARKKYGGESEMYMKWHW